MSEGIVEIRDYTIEPQWLDAYSKWADSLAAPWLRANLDVIDFWLDCGIDAEVGAVLAGTVRAAPRQGCQRGTDGGRPISVSPRVDVLQAWDGIACVPFPDA